MTEYFAGIDIGGTAVKAILVDGDLNRCAAGEQPTAAETPKHLVALVKNLVHRVQGDAGLSGANLAGIGVGIPGQIDIPGGVVRHAVNLNLHGFPLAAALTEQVNAPVTLDNDVIMAVQGAYRFLNPDRVSNFGHVNIGTGVSAGLILDGHVHRGQHGMAGEIGHMVIIDDGRPCQCGNRGCLEAYISGPAVAAAGRESGLKGDYGTLTAADLYRLAAEGHVNARTITTAAGRHLGRALQNLVMAYDVGRIVLGGGVTRAGHAFLQPVLEEWQHQAERSPLAAAMLDPDLLVLTPPDFNAGTWGAALVARQMFGRDGQTSAG